jgi:outer membrane protein assembly factor BamB
MRLASATLFLLALCPAVLPAAEPSPAVIPGESKPLATRLEEARRALAAKKYSEGIALLASIIEASPTELLPTEDGHSAQGRLLCHLELARLPAEGLALYRKRVDVQAKRALDSALQGPDSAGLVRLVDEAFCSTSTPAALDRLGDRGFERGRFAEAESWWRLIAPLEPDRDTLAYPDPSAALADRARAKQLLARLFAGRADFERDLASFRKRHPKAEGSLAGRKGTYADVLDAVARQRRAVRAGAAAGDWTTFAGAPSRNRVVPARRRLLDRLSQLGRGGPTWRFDLNRRVHLEQFAPTLPLTTQAAQVDAARRLAFHPVVVGHHALVADARFITAYDLRTGKASTWYDLDPQVFRVQSMLTLPVPFLDLRYTLTVADDCVFARMGSQAVRDVRPDLRGGNAADAGESVLVSLSVKARPGGRQRWLVRAIDPGRKDFSVFEGAPLVAGGRVFVAATRFEGDRVVTAVRCYPAHPEDTSPLPMWRTDVCETHELMPAGRDNVLLQRRYRHHLLTLAGSRVVYCSHTGAVVALDARTGQRAWALRYPRRDVREPEDEPTLRDLAPCVFARGKLYVAPADCETLYCLDPLTGRVIWKRDRLDAVHLLGVGQGRLIFTTWRNPQQGALYAGGLRAVGADDGSDDDGWMLPDDGGGLVPFGRGLLVGDLVLWPTVRRPFGEDAKRPTAGRPFGVFAIRQFDGKQPDNPTLLHRIPSGNLVWANGCLLVADRTTLWAFVPPEQLADEDDRGALGPRQALRGARAAAARGQRDLALARYETVLKMPAATRRFQTEARHERQGLHLAAAAEAAAHKKPAEAARWLALAGQDTGALVGAAQAWTEAGDGARAVRAWQAVLRNGDTLVEDSQGVPRRAARVALSQIGLLLSRNAAALAEAQQQARAILASAEKDGRDKALARLAREVPFAPAARAALADKARAQAKARRFERSAWWWGWLVATLPAGKERAEALAGLAGAWQEMGCQHAARMAREKAGQRDEPRLQPRAEALRLPLLAQLSLTLPAAERFLAPPAREGPGAARLWSSTRRGELVCRDRHSGEERWRAALGFEPGWLDTLGHLVVVAGPGGVVALDMATGESMWRFGVPAQRLYPVSTAVALRVSGEVRPGGPLGEFHRSGERLLLVQGGRLLLALDATSGETLWQFRAPGAGFDMPAPRGRIHHLVPLEPGLVLAQVSGQGVLLDGATGRVVRAWPGVVPAWRQPPVTLSDGSVLTVPQRDRVECLAPQAKRPMRWTFTPAGKTTRTGDPPLVVAGGDRAVVVVPENLGPRLVRLDQATGKVVWRGQPMPQLQHLAPESFLVDGSGQTLYHAEGNRLWAWSIDDGKLAWRRDLPASAVWKLAQGGDTLLAYPARSAALTFRLRWLAGSLQWRIGPWPEEHALAVLCLEARTGELVERLNLPLERVSDRVDRSSGRRRVFPKLHAGLDPAGVAGPVVWWDRQGLVLGAGGQVRCAGVDVPHPSE